MKRSEINRIIDESISFIEEMGFKTPEWVKWKLPQWKAHKDELDEIIDNMLGWDVTDFGSGDFLKEGLIMLNLRNGNFTNKEKYKKPYAEKILITEENQVTPTHFHWSKMEDIINRGGGTLIVELWNSTPDEEKASSDVLARVDGILTTVKAGGSIELKPGQSITLEPETYHRFYGKPGTGRILIGEVSSVNDDNIDNRFYENLPRFPELIEDEPADYILITEYKEMLK